MSAPLFDAGDRGATVSEDGRYRYDLWRRWDDGPVLAFVMCNPSTADADTDDPTIRRCIGFARREGLAGIVVRNLWAWRAAKPVTLAAAALAGRDVVGPENDAWIADLVDPGARFAAGRIVAAWGALGAFSPLTLRLVAAARVATVESILGDRLDRFHPPDPGPVAPHPLYLRADTPLAQYPLR